MKTIREAQIRQVGHLELELVWRFDDGRPEEIEVRTYDAGDTQFLDDVMWSRHIMSAQEWVAA